MWLVKTPKQEEEDQPLHHHENSDHRGHSKARLPHLWGLQPGVTICHFHRLVVVQFFFHRRGRLITALGITLHGVKNDLFNHRG